MPEEPPEPPRTPMMILADLSSVIAGWIAAKQTFLDEILIYKNYPLGATESLLVLDYCHLNRVPTLLLELGVALGAGYDFDAWVKDLAEKGTPEAKELAEKVWKALDNLAGVR